MAQISPSSIPYGECIIRWWETSRSDPEEAQDWLTERMEALAVEFQQRFPRVVARTETET